MNRAPSSLEISPLSTRLVAPRSTRPDATSFGDGRPPTLTRDEIPSSQPTAPYRLLIDRAACSVQRGLFAPIAGEPLIPASRPGYSIADQSQGDPSRERASNSAGTSDGQANESLCEISIQRSPVLRAYRAR